MCYTIADKDVEGLVGVGRLYVILGKCRGQVNHSLELFISIATRWGSVVPLARHLLIGWRSGLVHRH